MPNPLRLAVLIELRESAGLTQADAAECCGLRGRQSRKTLAAWEIGQWTPRQRFRLPFAVYLLRDLGLWKDLARFDAIDEMLVEEWEWSPLTAEERADCLRTAKVETEVGSPPSVAGNAVQHENRQEVVPEKAGGAQRRFRQSGMRAFSILGGLAVVAVLAVLSNELFGRILPDTLPIPATSPTVTTPAPTPPPPTSTPTPKAFANGSFETGVAPWYPVNEGDSPCELEVITDTAGAKEGESFLRIVDPGNGCVSLRQDIGQLVGDVVHVALHVRTLQSQPVQGELVLWAIQNVAEDAVVRRAGVPVKLLDNQWRCVEVVGALDQTEDQLLRAEFYFGSDPAQWDVDAVKIGFGDGVLCPPELPSLQDGGFEFDITAGAWNWLDRPCDFAVLADEEQAYVGGGYLSVKRTPGCNSFYQDATLSSMTGEQTWALSLQVAGSITQTVRGRISLRATGSGMPAQVVSDDFVAGPEWRCVRVVLPEVARGYTRLRSEIYLDTPVGEGAYRFDAIELTAGESAGCEPDPTALINPGFENNPSFPVGWSGIGLCDLQVVVDQSAAFEGVAFLAATRGNNACYSIFQDVVVKPTPGETVRGALWVRAPGGVVNLTIRAMGGPDGAEVSENLVSLSGDEWQCVEVAHRIEREGHQQLRLELYLNTPGDLVYQIDEAQVERFASTPCPQTDLALSNSLFVPITDFSYPSGSIGTATIVHNWGETESPAGKIAYWLSDAPNGGPLDSGLIKHTIFSALMPGVSTSTLFGESRVPPGISPGDYYVVWDLPPIAGVIDTQPDNNRFSLPIQIRPCETGVVYCDVPQTYWAFNEIEQWHNSGITNGCRSGTTPYQDRPFCPDLMAIRSELPVFFLRSLYGKDYLPTGSFHGLFADVLIDMAHNREYWIEAFHLLGADLSSDRCAPSGSDRRYFCPDLPLTRWELLLYLAQAQGWELSPVQGDLFSDVREDSPANRAIEYAARHDVLAPGDPYCPSLPTGPRFCPTEPARRAFIAAVMVRAFASAPQNPVAE